MRAKSSSGARRSTGTCGRAPGRGTAAGSAPAPASASSSRTGRRPPRRRIASPPLLIVYADQFAWPARYYEDETAAILADAEEHAERTIGEVVDHVRRLHPGIAVTCTSVHAPTLLDLAQDAELLVVGNLGERP